MHHAREAGLKHRDWGASIQSGPKLPRGLTKPSFVKIAASHFSDAAAVSVSEVSTGGGGGGAGPATAAFGCVSGEAPGRADSW